MDSDMEDDSFMGKNTLKRSQEGDEKSVKPILFGTL